MMTFPGLTSNVYLSRLLPIPYSPRLRLPCSLLAKSEYRTKEQPTGQAVPAQAPLRGNCYGCGASLQLEEPAAAGYVEADRYEQKHRHKQLDQLICWRCRQLSNGAMLPAVEDGWAKRQSSHLIPKLLATPEQLRSKLAVIREHPALVVLLVDLLDASGSFVSKLRDLTGRNPLVLVGTKVDLLPKGTDPQDVIHWLQVMAEKRKMNVIHTGIVSSKTGEGISEAAAFIRQNRLGRDVYIVGAANVGKSAFSRAFVKEMSDMTSRQYDPAAAATASRLPVASAMPGTTLQLIPLRAFHSGGFLIDTPGLHLHHRVPHMLTPEEAKWLQPRGRLKPYLPPTPAELNPPAVIGNSGQKETFSATYLWGGLARIDILAAPESCALTFFGSPKMRVTAMPLRRAGMAGQLPADRVSTGGEQLFGAESAEAQGGLRIAKEAVLVAKGQPMTLADIAISGVPGWIAVRAAGRGQFQLRLWAPVGVEAFVRQPLPCPHPALESQTQ